MANVKPFRGVRYDTSKIESLKYVTAPPYDIISPAEQDNLCENKYNIVHLELGKIFNSDTDSDNRYTRAGKTLNDWIKTGILKRDDMPAYYLYEEIFTLPDGSIKSLKGLISAVELVPFSEKIILPHEETLSKAKADRFNLMSETHANLSPIYFLYMDEKKTLNKIIEDVSKGTPDESFNTPDGITHNLWIIKDNSLLAQIEKSFEDKQLFIADGHHRYETALNFREKLKSEISDFDKSHGGNYVMAFAVEMDDPGLVVLPTHRILQNLEKFDEEKIVHDLKENFKVEKINSMDIAKDAEKALDSHKNNNSFAFYTGKDYFYLLTLNNNTAMKKRLPNRSQAYRNLDVSVLHTLILDNSFGIDTENMANQKNLVYTKFTDEAIDSVKQGKAQCSFLLNATKVRQIKDVSLLNEKMPQKSTYFYPKLITGLVINKFEEEL